jgi:hypothetical protein
VRVVSTVAYINQVSTSICALQMDGKGVYSMHMYLCLTDGASSYYQGLLWERKLQVLNTVYLSAGRNKLYCIVLYTSVTFRP